MNRRSFLCTTGATLVGGALLKTSSAYGQSTSINTSVYSGGTSANAIASSNALVATSTNNDWNTVSNTLTSIYNDWTANNMDSVLQPYYSQVDPTQVVSANLNQQAILQQIQQFQPGATLSQVQNALSYLDTQPSSATTQVIANLAQTGLVPYLQVAVPQAIQFGQAAYYVPPKNGPGHPVQPLSPAVYHPSNQAILKKVSCAGSNLGAFAVGTAFAVIAIMAGPADVLLLAGWGAVSLWGGTAAAGWGIGNAIKCGF